MRSDRIPSYNACDKNLLLGEFDMKKKYNYFQAFAEQVNYCVQAAEYLEKSLNSFDPDTVATARKELHAIENEADYKKHELMDNLAKEFVPPIDREDIVELAHQIDEVVDSIEDVYLRAYMFNLTVIPPAAQQFTRIISMCCRTLRDIMEEFPNYRKSERIKALIIDVNTMEEEGDKLYLESMRKLHTEEKDIHQLLALTYCYERLEKCCDNCEHVANVAESVIMKNS